MDDELKRLIESSAAETRNLVEEIRNDSRQVAQESRANLDVVAEGVRRDARQVAEETRRHFDLVAEGLEKKIQLIAEGVVQLGDRLDREVGGLRQEMGQGFLETQA